MPVLATTTLPDEQQPGLDNGVKDEITVERVGQPTNNGLARFQIRETGETTWDSAAAGFDETAVAFNATTALFSGLLDGEAYEARARSETDYRTGEWTQPVEIVTKFPGAINLTATATSPTEVELVWTENADNEDGQLIVREQLRDGESLGERIVDDAGPDTESYTDTTPAPDTTYRYRIRAYTPFAEADSNGQAVTTDDIGISRRRVPASGWRVEIDHPDRVAPLTPTVLEDSTPKASLNDVQRVEVHVAKDDRWEDEQLRRAPMRVWKDGERLPIERFERAVRTPENVVLHGRGGIELDRDIEFDIGELTDVDDVVRDLIVDETPYTEHVDEPEPALTDDVDIISADSTFPLLNAFAALDELVGNDVPARFFLDPTELVPTPVRWLQSSRLAETTQLARLDEFDTYWDGRAHRLQDNGDIIEWEIQLEHRVPTDELSIRVRREDPIEGASPEVTATFDGEFIETFPADQPGAGGDNAPQWTFIGSGSQLSADTLDTGTYTVRLEVTGTSSDSDAEWAVDGLGVQDDRYAESFDSDGAAGIVDGVLQSPGPLPEAVELETEESGTIQQVVAGEAAVEIDDTSGQQAVAISNDGGATWIEASNATSVSSEFAESSTQIKARLTLSRYDTGDTSGLSSVAIGDGRQRATAFDLSVTLDDTPFAEGAGYDGSLLDVLQQLADNHNFIFELRWDDETDSIAVEWTQPGQRSASTSAAVLDYETETDSETLVEETIVYGRSRRVRDVEAQLPTSGYADVGDDYIQPGTERVRDPDTGEVYQINDDYEILFNEGVIKAVEGGAISDGDTVLLDFETRIAERYELPTADGTRDTIRRTVEAASTRQLAEQAAIAITKELSEPQCGARVTLDRSTFGLVGALDIEGAPIEPEVVREIDAGERTVDIRLGNRGGASETFDRIERRVESVARRL